MAWNINIIKTDNIFEATDIKCGCILFGVLLNDAWNV